MESISQRICAAVAVGFCWSILALIFVSDVLGDKH
jgi:hypothetical protein